MRGVAIGNADGIRQAHNSFAPPEAQLSDPESRKATESDDLFHFVSYVHKAGSLWELDGLQEGPIKCCDCGKVCTSSPGGLFTHALRHVLPCRAVSGHHCPIRKQPHQAKILSVVTACCQQQQ